LQCNLQNIFHLIRLIHAPIFFLIWFVIGCASSAPNGSSPQGYNGVLAADYRLKNSLTSILSISLVWICLHMPKVWCHCRVCRFCFSRHVTAHIPSNASYLRANPFIFTIYQFFAPPPPPLLPSSLSTPNVAPLHAHQACHTSQVNGEEVREEASGGLDRSTLMELDLAKDSEEGCNIAGIESSNREETEMCIAFMHRKSGEFSRILKLKPKGNRCLSRRGRWYSPEECNGFRHDLFWSIVCGKVKIWI
jgi:hypothetical protein